MDPHENSARLDRLKVMRESDPQLDETEVLALFEQLVAELDDGGDKQDAI